MGSDDYVIDGDLVFHSTSAALKFYQEHYHKKKEWVGLTDDERIEISWGTDTNLQYAIAIEANLKDKNAT